MSYTLLSDTRPIGRKQYRCIWCGEAILAGERHRHEKSIFDGAFQDHRWHTECDSDAAGYFAGGDDYFEAHAHERPKQVGA